MVRFIKKENKELYQCEECSFHYENREWPRNAKYKKSGTVLELIARTLWK